MSGSKRRFRPVVVGDRVSRRTSQHSCPACGYVMDAISSPVQQVTAVPKRGDFAMCIKCGQILEFDAMLNLAIPDPGRLLVARLLDPALDALLNKMTEIHQRAFPRH